MNRLLNAEYDKIVVASVKADEAAQRKSKRVPFQRIYH